MCDLVRVAMGCAVSKRYPVLCQRGFKTTQRLSSVADLVYDSVNNSVRHRCRTHRFDSRLYNAAYRPDYLYCLWNLSGSQTRHDTAHWLLLTTEVGLGQAMVVNGALLEFVGQLEECRRRRRGSGRLKGLEAQRFSLVNRTTVLLTLRQYYRLLVFITYMLINNNIHRPTNRDLS